MGFESSEYSRTAFSDSSNTYILFVELICEILTQDSFSPIGLYFWSKLIIHIRKLIVYWIVCMHFNL